MSPSARLSDAEAALSAGRRDEAIALYLEVLTADPAQDAAAYLALVRQLYFARRYAEGLRWGAQGLERHADAAELWNVQAVLLRLQRRFPEALAAIERAVALQPAAAAMQVNQGNILLDLDQPERAAEVFQRLAQATPGDPAPLRLLARALLRLGRAPEALARLEEALALKPDDGATRLGLADLKARHEGPEAAIDVLEAGLALAPDDLRLMEAKALVLRQSGQATRTQAYLESLLPRFPDAAWIHFHLGDLFSEGDPARGIAHLRRALALAPDDLDHLCGLIQALERSKGSGETESLFGGASEAENLDEAAALAGRALSVGGLTPGHAKTLQGAFGRVCDFGGLDRLGDFSAIGRLWAKAGHHTALLRHMPQVRSLEDRRELMAQHRLCGEEMERAAARTPIRRPAPRDKGGRLRLGVMSSDLRQHVVSRFAQPLFDHLDRDRFELYAYSFYRGSQDAVQARIAAQSTAFRWRPEISARDAAQMIADDDLDFLIELGGSTHMNKLEVMAFRPAPRQASWLGYPHSAGLAAIDHLIVDPYNLPPDRDLLLEAPLVMPESWIAIGAGYEDAPPIAPGLPEERAGVLTFGSASNPQKFAREMLHVWARIVARTPGSQFLFIRPEAAAAIFRRNVLAIFAAEGVEQARVRFEPVWGSHLAGYDQVDVSLDTFPASGGTTTVDALWMGIPVVSLVGPAFFERLSYSILSNVGLGELCVADLAAYEALALELAADQPRRRALRAGLRDRILQSPLGRPEAFARDFYDLVARAVGA